MKVAFFTLGCKVNQYETQRIREDFESAGFVSCDTEENFDILVINSCSVTGESDRKTRQQLRKFRRKNPFSIIILTGCMVQAFPEEAKALLDADIVIGNRDTSKIIKALTEFLEEKQRICSVLPHEKGDVFNTPSISRFAERTRAYMKIQDGCERYCTYCIIPKARGFLRSKPLDLIEKEAEVLSENGYSEIVLVGINLSSFGKGENINLADAVEAASKPKGIKRVRLGSIEPDLITDEMLESFKNNSKFCPQFHLSLQSGCDETLRRMNRKYNTEFYEDLVARIRKIFPDAAITTDIMVGFPGETEEEFLESLRFAKKIKFALSHIFAYSKRKSTIAANMPNQITNAEKSRRSKIMIEACKENEKEFLMAQKNKTVSVLFETKENGFYYGFTPNYCRVAVQSETDICAKEILVLIEEAKEDYLIGKILN